MPQGPKTKTRNRSNIVPYSIKTLKIVHIKKKKNKTKQTSCGRKEGSRTAEDNCWAMRQKTRQKAEGGAAGQARPDLRAAQDRGGATFPRPGPQRSVSRWPCIHPQPLPDDMWQGVGLSLTTNTVLTSNPPPIHISTPTASPVSIPTSNHLSTNQTVPRPLHSYKHPSA